MDTTGRNIGRIERRIPMARFSIGEDDEDAPLANKRARFSEPASQSQPRSQRQRSVQRSESRVVAVEEDEEEEDDLFPMSPIEDVESDSQGFEEEDEDDEFEGEGEVGSEDDSGGHAEGEAVSEGQIHQQQMTSSMAASSHLGLGNLAVGLRNCNTVSPVFNNAIGALQVVLTDPDVLDCPICLDPLCTPVFQCENGHIACSTCCSKVKRKCPSCCMPIGYNRCRAIEKVIESIRVSCKNSRYGCKEMMPYSKKGEHEQSCPHATCFCPHPSCPFAASSKNLYLHFGIQHAASTTRFTYNTTFTLRVETHQKHVLLQEQHESVIFILNHEVQERARSFNVDCVGTSLLKTAFIYQLSAKSMETSVSLQSVPEIYAKWSEHNPRKNYLTVPSEFSGYCGILSLDVCIKKAQSST
ncbi:putative E3 ubiquitin-protein ligase SINA-like 9 [Cynara cardunculus var. scolymus]|uniref:putative E3 ubiquitin-protein ligase SINA-like 9 n=1 Tax=Cynara cardunculus var. scolymus TaxID=59895 RepID=UPI000D6294FA|nr:putative E3 ubiquitin-protein ligase SINA-like 9 [Cynara cardunculus var. scolymus]